MQPLSKVESFFSSSYVVSLLEDLPSLRSANDALKVTSNQNDAQEQQERSQLVKMLADCGDCV